MEKCPTRLSLEPACLNGWAHFAFLLLDVTLLDVACRSSRKVWRLDIQPHGETRRARRGGRQNQAKGGNTALRSETNFVMIQLYYIWV